MVSNFVIRCGLLVCSLLGGVDKESQQGIREGAIFAACQIPTVVQIVQNYVMAGSKIKQAEKEVRDLDQKTWESQLEKQRICQGNKQLKDIGGRCVLQKDWLWFLSGKYDDTGQWIFTGDIPQEVVAARYRCDLNGLKDLCGYTDKNEAAKDILNKSNPDYMGGKLGWKEILKSNETLYKIRTLFVDSRCAGVALTDDEKTRLKDLNKKVYENLRQSLSTKFGGVERDVILKKSYATRASLDNVKAMYDAALVAQIPLSQEEKTIGDAIGKKYKKMMKLYWAFSRQPLIPQLEALVQPEREQRKKKQKKMFDAMPNIIPEKS